jgi:taurine dioxygenase
MRVERLGETFVARVHDLDLSQPLDDETYAALDKAWFENRVLAFPDQKLTEPQLMAISSHFGPLEKHVLENFHHNSYPEILMVSTVVEDGKPLGLADAGSYWHSDVSYKAEPSRASTLYGVEVPETGGDTLFCDTAAAYDALPDEMKTRLVGLRAAHDYAHRTKMQATTKGIRGELTAEQKAQTPEVFHPVVRTQPETGRKSIFVNPGFTTRIVDLGEDESAALLEELFAHCLQDRFRYRYQWQQGDLLAWDNAVTMHRATVLELPVGSRRTMWRTIISGDAPI